MNGGALHRLEHRPWGTCLWLVDLDRWQAPTQDLLSPEERTRAAGFAFEIDRRRYLAAHQALHQVLIDAGHGGHAAFEVGEHGKPRLGPPAQLAFNLSHSADRALIGTRACGDIGVDLEVLRPIEELDALAREHFTLGEMQALRACADERAATQAFLFGWTRKEACLKACGCGLSVAPKSFEAGIAPVDAQVRLRLGDGSEAVIEVASILLEENTIISVANVVKPPPRGTPDR